MFTAVLHCSDRPDTAVDLLADDLADQLVGRIPAAPVRWRGDLEARFSFDDVDCEVLVVAVPSGSDAARISAALLSRPGVLEGVTIMLVCARIPDRDLERLLASILAAGAVVPGPPVLLDAASAVSARSLALDYAGRIAQVAAVAAVLSTQLIP